MFYHSLVTGGTGADSGDTGDSLDSQDTILEYDITKDKYQEIGHMLEPRHAHAISVVQYSDFAPWCL